MKLRSLKVQLALFLGLFATYLLLIEKDFLFLLTILIALFFSITTDSLINFLKSKKIAITESSAVTGLIIGYVLSSDQSWWIIALAGIFAISSKHLIRFRKSHIFNPAAFGIFLTVLLFGVFTQWKGAYSWFFIIPTGIYFVLKIKRLDLIVSFFLASLFLYIPQAFLHNVSLLNVFGYFNYFFIFIMMIEPKTTPKTRLGRVMFGLGAAAFIFGFYESGVLLEVELFALLILNFLGVFLERRKA